MRHAAIQNKSWFVSLPHCARTERICMHGDSEAAIGVQVWQSRVLVLECVLTVSCCSTLMYFHN